MDLLIFWVRNWVFSGFLGKNGDLILFSGFLFEIYSILIFGFIDSPGTYCVNTVILIVLC